MASSRITDQGEFAPCADCTHIDCVQLRNTVQGTCRLCEEPIGYNRNYYLDPEKPKAYVHAVCLEDFYKKNINI